MDEPGLLLRSVTFFVASGDAGILGAMGIACVALLHDIRKLSLITNSFIVFSVSAALLVLGAPPFPIWFQVVTGIWILFVAIDLWNYKRIREISEVGRTSNKRRIVQIVSMLWILVAMSFELPNHFVSLPHEPVTKLLVIGDSVTAGLNNGDDTWPKQLSRRVQVELLDASQPGATVHSALKQNRLLGENLGHVIIEIGGNDMLEGLPSNTFESQLDELLTSACRPGRTVMMLELPLPPLCIKYGIAQRRLASKHDVYLIPKREFARILTSKGATVDSIHLSNEGHRRMSDWMQLILPDQLKHGIGSHRRIE
jgi:acyl-CoA thioesterase-1